MIWFNQTFETITSNLTRNAIADAFLALLNRTFSNKFNTNRPNNHHRSFNTAFPCFARFWNNKSPVSRRTIGFSRNANMHVRNCLRASNVICCMRAFRVLCRLFKMHCNYYHDLQWQNIVRCALCGYTKSLWGIVDWFRNKMVIECIKFSEKIWSFVCKIKNKIMSFYILYSFELK